MGMSTSEKAEIDCGLPSVHFDVLDLDRSRILSATTACSRPPATTTLLVGVYRTPPVRGKGGAPLL